MNFIKLDMSNLKTQLQMGRGSTSPLIDNFWTENTISGFTLIHTGWHPVVSMSRDAPLAFEHYSAKSSNLCTPVSFDHPPPFFLLFAFLLQDTIIYTVGLSKIWKFSGKLLAKDGTYWVGIRGIVKASHSRLTYGKRSNLRIFLWHYTFL